MLNMRSTAPVRDPLVPADSTARARIRDAAIVRFAVDGMGAGLRAIAQDAGVSAALVLHHFGSKDGLREACDAHVLRTIRAGKEKSLGPGGPDQVLLQMAAVDEYAPMVGYALRSLQAGGDLATSFFDHFVADAEEYIAAGVAAGSIRPSRDEKARARYVTLQGFGALLLDMTLNPPEDRSDLIGYVRGYLDRVGVAAVELVVEGFLTDHRVLDEYLAYVDGQPGPSGAT